MSGNENAWHFYYFIGNGISEIADAPKAMNINASKKCWILVK